MSNDIWDWIEDQLTKPGHGWSPDSEKMLAVYDLRAKLTPPELAVSDGELPELPEPEVFGSSYYDEQTRTFKWKRHFTADQMRAYATEHAAYWFEMHRAASARADGETQRLNFMLLHGFTVKRMVDTGGYMLLHEEYPFDGGEFETPREAIDAALLDFQSPPTPVSEAQS